MRVWTARPPRRLTPARFSFRADDPVRMKRRPLSSMWRCTSLSRLGSRCISSTNTHPPEATACNSPANRPTSAR